MAITYDGVQNLLPAKHLCLEQLQIQTILIKKNSVHYTNYETILLYWQQNTSYQNTTHLYSGVSDEFQ